MRKLPKSKSIQIKSSFATSRNGIRAICRAISKGYTIKLLPTSFQHGSKGGECGHSCLARRGVAVRRRAVLRPRAERSAPFLLVIDDLSDDHRLRIARQHE